METHPLGSWAVQSVQGPRQAGRHHLNLGWDLKEEKTPCRREAGQDCSQLAHSSGSIPFVCPAPFRDALSLAPSYHGKPIQGLDSARCQPPISPLGVLKVKDGGNESGT